MQTQVTKKNQGTVHLEALYIPFKCGDAAALLWWQLAACRQARQHTRQQCCCCQQSVAATAGCSVATFNSRCMRPAVLSSLRVCHCRGFERKPGGGFGWGVPTDSASQASRGGHAAGSSDKVRGAHAVLAFALAVMLPPGCHR